MSHPIAHRKLVAETCFTDEERKIHGGGFKTVCTGSVLKFFGVSPSSYRYCQDTGDMARIFRRNGWRMNFQRKKDYVGQHYHKLNQFFARGFYCVLVDGHVFLIYIDDEGNLSFPVDTGGFHKLAYPEVQKVFKIEMVRDFSN